MNDYFIKESELYALPEQYRTVSADGVRYLAYHQAVSTLGSFYIDKEDGCNPSATIAASVWSKQRENGYVIDRFYCSVMSLTITSRTNRTIEASVRYRVRFEGSAGLLNYTSAPQEPLTLREVYEQQVSFVHTSDGWKIRSFPGLEIFLCLLRRRRCAALIAYVHQDNLVWNIRRETMRKWRKKAAEKTLLDVS